MERGWSMVKLTESTVDSVEKKESTMPFQAASAMVCCKSGLPSTQAVSDELLRRQLGYALSHTRILRLLDLFVNETRRAPRANHDGQKQKVSRRLNLLLFQGPRGRK